MLGAAVNANLGEHLAAEGTLGHHAADGFIDCEFGLLVEELTILGHFESAGITGVMIINFFVKLSACHDDFICVDDDNVIAAVNMRGKDGLVFSAEYCGNLRCETTEHHAFCIYNVPLTLHGFCFCHIAFHAMSSKGMLNFLIK